MQKIWINICMEKCEDIFIDSSYLIALGNPIDSLHNRAKEIAAHLVKTDHAFFITNFIFLEVVTVLSQRQGRKSALEVGTSLLIAPSIEMLHIDPQLQQETWSIFHSVAFKDISFVDCSIIATMKAQGISTLLAFDTHFKKLQKHHRFSLYA